MLQGVNNAFNSGKRTAREDQFILESVLGNDDDILNEMDDEDMDDVVDADSIPPEVMNKVDAALDKIIGNGIDDEEIDEMLDDDNDDDAIDIAITEACGPWYDDEKIGHPNKAIRDGVKHQPRFMSKDGLDLSCEMMEDLETM